MSEIKDIVERFLDGYSKENLYTSLPAVITSTHNYGSRQTIDVRPVISKVSPSGYVMTNKDITIYEVPVVSPAGGGGLLSFPLKVGDTVWLNFSMRSLEEWQYSNGSDEITPSDSRHFHITDAIAFPCIFTSNKNLSPSTENIELKFNNSFVSLKPSGDIDIYTSNSAVSIKEDGSIKCSNSSGDIELEAGGNIDIKPSSKVTIHGNLDVTGDITVSKVTASNDVIGGGKSLKLHTHNVIAVSSPTSAPL